MRPELDLRFSKQGRLLSSFYNVYVVEGDDFYLYVIPIPLTFVESNYK